MRLRFDQLSGHLSRGLAPVYLLCGDEPYQLGQAATAVRARARKEGFDEREVLDQDGSFDWSTLAASANAMSLFSARKLIELRLGTGKIGRDGSAAVREYCQRPCPDNVLLILAPSVERKELQSAWAKDVEAAGVLLQVWPLKGQAMEQWIVSQLRAAGFQPSAGLGALLAERAEGNLLAAAQEIEKLGLLHEPGPLTEEDLLGNLADNARFDLFALSDAALSGDRARVRHVLEVLRGEGTAEPLVLWVLTRELRMLAEAAGALARRGSPGEVFNAHRVPRQRIPTLERALRELSVPLLHGLLQECARADQTIKGLRTDDTWRLFAGIADALAARGYRIGTPSTSLTD